MSQLTQHEINQHVSFPEGKGGLTKAVLRIKSGSSAEVYLHGGHVTSFVNEEGKEMMFVSSKSIFSREKSIRGGIPVIFPQFGPGPLPQHGFARTELWSVVSSAVGDNGNEVTLVLELHSSEATRKIWPHDFVLVQTITLSYNATEKSRLFQQLEVRNTGTTSFDFTTALHTYFAVSDVKQTQVVGLQNLTYFDKVKNNPAEQIQERLTFANVTDNVYYNAPNKVLIIDDNARIYISKSNLPDMVVWNGWEKGAKAMADMGDDDWVKYVCCEVAAVQNPVALEPSQTWSGSQILQFAVPDSKY
eukprot:TRINITY_DN1140_c0_g1_i2.p1 TRINITY_DN1140_c0_g1~~TRINITY_DN1140_c0_g1_i2.p1  ORF type:complete len:303 (-),score=52.20 TRINITY_DN1140_c0_g1_i2:96-1004(-)